MMDRSRQQIRLYCPMRLRIQTICMNSLTFGCYKSILKIGWGYLYLMTHWSPSCNTLFVFVLIILLWKLFYCIYLTYTLYRCEIIWIHHLHYIYIYIYTYICNPSVKIIISLSLKRYVISAYIPCVIPCYVYAREIHTQVILENGHDVFKMKLGYILIILKLFSTKMTQIMAHFLMESDDVSIFRCI